MRDEVACEATLFSNAGLGARCGYYRWQGTYLVSPCPITARLKIVGAGRLKVFNDGPLMSKTEAWFLLGVSYSGIGIVALATAA
jgi:hypothetical protein